MRPRDPVHFLHHDGQVVCKRVDLFDSARPLADGPPRITIYIEDVTCRECQRWHRHAEPVACAS